MHSMLYACYDFLDVCLYCAIAAMLGVWLGTYLSIGGR